MRFVLIGSFIIIFSDNLKAQGFRGFSWGISLSQIIKKEGPPDRKQGTSVTYTDKYLLGYETTVIFYFLPNMGLAHGLYYIEYNENNYKEIEAKMRYKYGMPMLAPDLESSIWDVADTRISLMQDINKQKILIKYYKKAWMEEFIRYAGKQVTKDL